MNKRIVVKGKSYFVDTQAYTVGMAHAIEAARLSDDVERIKRLVGAVLILALGIVVFIDIPMEDFSDVMEAVLQTLTIDFGVPDASN